MTLHWIWESAWGSLWRAAHSCSGRGNQVSLLRRGQQVLVYSYGSVFEQKDSGRERQQSPWLRALWLCVTCCNSYRNKSSTPCLYWWVLSSHWDKLMPDWIPWLFSSSFTCLNLQNSRGFPDQPRGLLAGLLSSSLWNCRLLNLAVGFFTLPECLLIHPKHSFLMFFFPPSPVLSHFPPKNTFCEPKKGEEGCFLQLHMFLWIFFSPQKHFRNNYINFCHLSHSKKTK